MNKIFIPEGYKPTLDEYNTQKAISYIKKTFQQELADALNYAAEELQKNDSLQKELVANISHDLRTPLTMIKGYSEVMRDIPEEKIKTNFVK